jgi:hypothetical protein
MSKQHFAMYGSSTVDITKDGHTMFAQDIIADLNRKSHLEVEIITLRKANAELKKEKLDNDLLVMCNARRLIKAKAITSNGRLYSELFGTGCGAGRERCRELGLNPDCNKTDYHQTKTLKESK